MDAAFQQGAGPAQVVPAQASDPSMEEAFKEAQQGQQVQQDESADLEQAAQMVEMLRSSGNPKFANSQFVNFIDKVSKGDLQFKDNTVIDRDGNNVDWDSLYDTAAATASDTEKRELENLWKASSSPSLEQAWNASEPEMEAAWQAAASETEIAADLERLWRDTAGAGTVQEALEAWRQGEDGLL